MSKPLIVFVHGGQHTGKCWSPTVDAIAQRDSQLPMLAIDLPGHGDEPGDLSTLTIEQCVDSVVEKIQAHGAGSVILVGHSMAGITLPGVIERLGADRVSRAVYVSCCAPPQGKRVLDTLHPPMSFIASLEAKRTKVAKPLPKFMANWVFGNGMTQAQKRFMHSCLCNESTCVTVEPVDRNAMPKVPTTWLLLLKDRALSPKTQRQFIDNLGCVDDVIELDACHNVMISEPDTLAEIVLQYV